MIDDKRIEEAARTYSKVTDCVKEEASLIEEGFNEGAHWAINEFFKNLWHPISENPNIKQGKHYVMCLVKFTDECVDVCMYLDSYGWSCEFNIEERLKQDSSAEWLYIDDLLKGGEQ